MAKRVGLFQASAERHAPHAHHCRWAVSARSAYVPNGQLGFRCAEQQFGRVQIVPRVVSGAHPVPLDCGDRPAELAGRHGVHTLRLGHRLGNGASKS